MGKGWPKLGFPSRIAIRYGKVVLWIVERFGPPVLVMFVGYWWIDLPQNRVSLVYDITKTIRDETNEYRILMTNVGSKGVEKEETFFLISFDGSIAKMENTIEFPSGTKILNREGDEVRTCIGLKECKVLPVLGKGGTVRMKFTVASDVRIKDLPLLDHKGTRHAARECWGLRPDLQRQCPTTGRER